MNPYLILLFAVVYFAALLFISWLTSRNANNDTYFIGNHSSPWFAVAFGMIGDSLSGVTYISVPGAVGAAKFSYLQIVLGYVVGYWVIALLLLPLYYRMQLTSIYTYLFERFGMLSQKTGAFYFLMSRLLGAAGRLYLAAGVMQLFVFDALGIPFWISVSIIIILMLVYTLKGGIKTLVWTDAFQSLFLLLGVILSIYAITSSLEWSFSTMITKVAESSYATVFHWDVMQKNYFVKQFAAGIFIAVAMTGLDQNMMQKNLSCKSLGDAQKNIFTFSFIVLLVNLFFLCLGALLYLYANEKGIAIPQKTDDLFPTLALQHLGTFAGMVFIVGLIAATFNSADSVLTTLTTSFYIDFLGLDKRTDIAEKRKTKQRMTIHIVFAVLMLLVILMFQAMNNKAIIDTILMIAGYTYGPLLGMYAFGLFSKRKVVDVLVPFICIASPIASYLLSVYVPAWTGGYQIGYELLIVNGALTFFGLYLSSILKEKKLFT